MIFVKKYQDARLKTQVDEWYLVINEYETRSQKPVTC